MGEAAETVVVVFLSVVLAAIFTAPLIAALALRPKKAKLEATLLLPPPRRFHYGIPLSHEGEDLDDDLELVPGVQGYVIEKDGIFWVPLIVAEEEGSGAVGLFLDTLPPGHWRFPNVISARLAGMLNRRGFTVTGTSGYPPHDPEIDDGYCWEKVVQ